MEPVFISVGVMVGALLLIAFMVQNGVGGMSQPANPGPFPARQGPRWSGRPLDDSAGRGGRLGRFGLAWLVLAGTLGFVGRWHDWDATALDSLASLGWSYDDGSGLATTISMTLRTGLVMVFIGTTLTAARTSGGRLSSEASASMMALVFTGVSLLVLLLPTLAGLFGMDAATEDLLSKVVSSVVLHTVVGGALLVNVLITLANRGDAPIAYTRWFLVNALVVMLVAPLLYIGGERSGTQTVVGPRPRRLAAACPHARHRLRGDSCGLGASHLVVLPRHGFPRPALPHRACGLGAPGGRPLLENLGGIR